MGGIGGSLLVAAHFVVCAPPLIQRIDRKFLVPKTIPPIPPIPPGARLGDEDEAPPMERKRRPRWVSSVCGWRVVVGVRSSE